MSQPDLESVSSAPSVLTKKPQLNIYTALLVIALVSLLLGCMFLILLWQRYEFDSSGQLTGILRPLTDLGANLWA